MRAKVAERLESDPLTPVTIDTDVGDLKTAYLMEHQGQFPGVQITETYLRNYEQGGLAAQILGYVTRDRPRAARGSAPTRAMRRATASGRRGSRPPTTTTCAASRGQGRVFVDALGPS